MKSLSIIINIDQNRSSKLEKTIESILDNTRREDIADIILICDGNAKYELDYFKLPIRQVIRKANLPATFNELARDLKSTHVAFICDDIKVVGNGSDEYWWESPDDDDIYSIPEYDLDAYLWQSRGKLVSGVEFENFGLKKYGSDTGCSATCTDTILIAKVKYFNDLGGFDVSYPSSFFTELCLRSCLDKKSYIHPFNKGTIACRRCEATGDNTRLCYEYLRKHYKYYCLVNGLTQLHDYRSKDVETEEFVKLHFDESLFRLYDKAVGKRIAIIGYGSSIDEIQPDWFSDYDILIGIDYMGSVMNCDYCITDRLEVVSAVINSSKCRIDNMVLPYKLEDKVSGKWVANPYKDSIKYSVSDKLLSKYPPFIKGSIESIALHLAIFMSPNSITLYGYDFRIVNDVSHTKKTRFYNDGKIWKNTEASMNILRQREREIEALVRLAEENKIKVMRITYA